MVTTSEVIGDAAAFFEADPQLLDRFSNGELCISGADIVMRITR
jgi:hypothetical protein